MNADVPDLMLVKHLLEFQKPLEMTYLKILNLFLLQSLLLLHLLLTNKDYDKAVKALMRACSQVLAQNM